METIDEWGSQQLLNKLRCCIGGGWPRTLSFLGMPTVLIVAVSSHNLLPRDEIVDMRCLFYTMETSVREKKCTGASRLREDYRT